MSASASWGSTNHLEVASAAGAGTDAYLDHGWVYNTGTAVGTMIVSGDTNSSLAHTRAVSDRAANGFVTARMQDGASGGSATTLNAYSTSAWQSWAGAFVSSTLRESWCAGSIANKGTNTNSINNNAPAYTRVGSQMDGTLSNVDFDYAEISRWSVVGFSETDRNALITRLNTLVGSLVPNPLTVNDDVGEAWSERLLRYWPLDTTNTTTEMVAGVNNLSIVGTVNFIAGHPDVEAYSTTTLFPSMEPLYYGTTRLDSKTGINYLVATGHTGLDGEIIAAGVNATTDSTGNIVWPGSGFAGAAADPVTVHLYWEEGTTPVVDRSLIVKTTLVAE